MNYNIYIPKSQQDIKAKVDKKMNVFDALNLICGLSFFLFGMNFMAERLKAGAGNKMQDVVDLMTASRLKGFFWGLGVTALIQSSSAATVMVVSLVNSGSMTLSRAISVIMGANVGTTVTSWLTGLSGLGTVGAGSVAALSWFKPASFVPILASLGVIYYLRGGERRKNIGLILLGFSILMVGMEMMSDAVKPLSESERFKNILIWFENPLLGVLAGAFMTAILQSSSAAVGILQSISVTGALTYAEAVPILLGQNIGTCITALISSVGTSTNAKRAALVHFYFNVIGVAIFMVGFYIVDGITGLPFMPREINMWGIAGVHTIFNIIAVITIAPFSKYLERLVSLSIKEKA